MLVILVLVLSSEACRWMNLVGSLVMGARFDGVWYAARESSDGLNCFDSLTGVSDAIGDNFDSFDGVWTTSETCDSFDGVWYADGDDFERFDGVWCWYAARGCTSARLR